MFDIHCNEYMDFYDFSENADAYKLIYFTSGTGIALIHHTAYPLQPGSVLCLHPFEYAHIVASPEEPPEFRLYIFYTLTGEVLYNIFLRTYIQLSANTRAQDLIHLLAACTERAHLLRRPNPVTLSPLLTKALTSLTKSLPRTISEWVETLNTSDRTLEKHFTRAFNIHPSTYLRNTQMLEAARLRRNGHTVQNAAFQCGYRDTSHFIQVFRKIFGVTPGKYR